jgi:outer membrane protein OmpA-like peptidoglycan-associated protein
MVISPDEKFGYFASHRADSYGDKDLYFIDFKTEVRKDTLKPQPVAVTKVVIHFYDEKTGEPISPNVQISTPRYVLKFLPSYFVKIGELVIPKQMLPEPTFQLVATLPQYEMKTLMAPNLPSESMDSVFEYEVYLSPIELENPSQNLLVTIYFNFDKYDIRESEKPKMEKVLQILQENPHIELSIEGHTDIRGSDQYNLILSKRRAMTARNYLIERGVEARRLDIKYYGESRPIDHSNTPQGHQRNRRVEFIIKGK